MYFPYLRGKQFEVEALLEISSLVYQNTLPILEPITLSRPNLYVRLRSQSIPLILVTNPYHPPTNRLTVANIQTLINNQLSGHPSLILGFIIDQRFNITELNAFLTSNTDKEKALIFRHNPLPIDLTRIQAAANAHSVEYIIFDDRKTSLNTRNTFYTHPQQVLLTDGFQRQNRNADYPDISAFDSNYNTYQDDGWFGIGDYVTVGDHFTEGGGQAYVVSLHVTTKTKAGLVMHHFSSVMNRTIKGLVPQKFAEANGFLVGSPQTAPLVSSGLTLYRDWQATAHNPQLGAAKKASIMHHIELMSSLV